MAERASGSLLGFAIAASAAIVPVLLIVLLAVGFARSQEPGGPAARHAGRHVSVRAVAALKTFEHAIVKRRAVTAGPPSAAELLAGVPQCRAAWDGHPGPFERIRRVLARTDTEPPSPAQRLSAHLADLDAALRDFSTGGNRRVSEAVGFDAARWFDAVALAMQQPVEAPAYPGRAFAVQCPDIAGAAAMLARSNARMLAALSWRGTEVARVVDALAFRPVRRDHRPHGRARQPVGRPSGLHLPRQRRAGGDCHDPRVLRDFSPRARRARCARVPKCSRLPAISG